jgi:hypothetical protein
LFDIGSGQGGQDAGKIAFPDLETNQYMGNQYMGTVFVLVVIFSGHPFQSTINSQVMANVNIT